MSISRKYALITGASSGLGRAMAVRLAKDGWHIGIADQNADGARETQRLVEQAGGTAEFLSLNVQEESNWIAIRDDLRQRWPQLDLLVNNAGVSAGGEVGVTPIADWDWVLAINLRGVILGCHMMVDWLKVNPHRSYILNISSLAGLLSPPCMAAYGVSKAAVVSLSESLYVELKPHNVGVTVVCPWFVKTNLLAHGRFSRPSERSFGEQKMLRARTTPELFAERALRATFRNQFLRTMGWRSALLVWLRMNFRQTCLNIADRIYTSRKTATPAAGPEQPGTVPPLETPQPTP